MASSIAQTSNIREFEQAVSEFAKTLPKELLVPFHKKISLQALGSIVARTPVKSGRARINWQLTIGTPASGWFEGVDAWKDPAPANPGAAEASTAYNSGLATLAELPPFSVVWLTNNLPYIQRLEDGWSKAQAPNGMVSITVQELITQFQ